MVSACACLLSRLSANGPPAAPNHLGNLNSNIHQGWSQLDALLLYSRALEQGSSSNNRKVCACKPYAPCQDGRTIGEPDTAYGVCLTTVNEPLGRQCRPSIALPHGLEYTGGPDKTTVRAANSTPLRRRHKLRLPHQSQLESPAF